MVNQKLNALQLELLKVYAMQPSVEDLLAIKKLLANYFSDKLIHNIQQAIDKQEIKEEELEKWINE